MAYPLPTDATEEISGFYSLFKYVQNDVSGGFFFLAILLALFIIMFISLKRYSTSTAFTTAAFINMIFAIILRTLDLIASKWMYLSMILVAIGAVWLHLDKPST